MREQSGKMLVVGPTIGLLLWAGIFWMLYTLAGSAL